MPLVAPVLRRHLGGEDRRGGQLGEVDAQRSLLRVADAQKQNGTLSNRQPTSASSVFLSSS